MNIKVGKITEFDSFSGKIESDNAEYTFTKNDLLQEVKEQDYVLFESATIQGENRALLVQTLTKELSEKPKVAKVLQMSQLTK